MDEYLRKLINIERMILMFRCFVMASLTLPMEEPIPPWSVEGFRVHCDEAYRSRSLSLSKVPAKYCGLLKINAKSDLPTFERRQRTAFLKTHGNSNSIFLYRNSVAQLEPL